MPHFDISRDNNPPCWINFKDWINRDSYELEHPFLGRYAEIVLDPTAYEEELEQFGAKVDEIYSTIHAGDEYWKEKIYRVTFKTDAYYTAFLLKFGPSTEFNYEYYK